MKQIAKNIRRRRLQAGMSQEQLAKRLGVSKATVSNYERGVTDPSPAVMEQLADVFDVAVSYFFMRSPDMDDIPAEFIIGGLDLVTEAYMDALGNVMLNIVRQGESVTLTYSEYRSVYFRVCAEMNGVSEYFLMNKCDKIPENHGMIYACVNGANANIYYYTKRGVMHVLNGGGKRYRLKSAEKLCVLGVVCEPDWD
jgi:transcriptional regulator with XRE-family HTH domain